MSLSSEQLKQIWDKAVALVKEGAVNVALWEALEQCSPLALEEDKFYLGLEAAEIHRSSVINASQARAQVQSAIARILGQPVTLVLVEGRDEGALAREKERAVARAEQERRTKERLEQRRAQEDAASWDALSRTLHSGYAKLSDKGLPWKVVEYVREILVQVVAVEKERRQLGDDEREIERGLARILSALASQVDAPPLWVAAEYLAAKERAG